MCNKPSPPPSLESSCPNKNPTCWRLSTAVQVTVGAFMPPSRIVNAPTSKSQSKQLIISKTTSRNCEHYGNFRRSFYWPEEREALICLDDTACQKPESTLKNEKTLWSTNRPAPTNNLNKLQVATVANTGDQFAKSIAWASCYLKTTALAMLISQPHCPDEDFASYNHLRWNCMNLLSYCNRANNYLILSLTSLNYCGHQQKFKSACSVDLKKEKP